jgi:hypothetical protein
VRFGKLLVYFIAAAESFLESPRQDPPEIVIDHRMQIGSGAVEQSDDRHVQMKKSPGAFALIPIFDLSGWTRIRGRRQPAFLTSRYHVDGEVRAFPIRCA